MTSMSLCISLAMRFNSMICGNKSTSFFWSSALYFFIKRLRNYYNSFFFFFSSRNLSLRIFSFWQLIIFNLRISSCRFISSSAFLSDYSLKRWYSFYCLIFSYTSSYCCLSLSSASNYFCCYLSSYIRYFSFFSIYLIYFWRYYLRDCSISIDYSRHFSNYNFCSLYS
jgi:hypothetical protein